MRTNWAGNHIYEATDLIAPGSVEELQELIVASPKVRALGSRHSFTDLADTTGVQVSLEGLPAEVEFLEEAVRVPGGMRYGDVAAALVPRGLALANLASLPHISVAGAIATGTHGSGRRNGSLATSVRALELVDGRGELIRLTGAELDGAVVSMGMLGVVTAVELTTEPAFEIVQTVHEGLRWDTLLDDLEEVLGCAYSVSAFTRWTGDELDQVWVKSREAGVEVPGARPATEQRHMIAGMETANTTAQLGLAGPWHERLPHFRMGFLPSAGEELQSEYFVPFARAGEALQAVRAIGELFGETLMIAEVRTVRGDEQWLSGAYGTDVLALHFTWRRDLARVLPLVARLEEVLLPLQARPHWGKVMHADAATLAPLYPHWADFVALAEERDPEGRFRNAWSERHLGV